jgi:hypothetical protein
MGRFLRFTATYCTNTSLSKYRTLVTGILKAGRGAAMKLHATWVAQTESNQ